MKSRRTSYEIYWEILTFCKTAKSFTQGCGTGANLNSKIGQDYVDLLISKGYLRKVPEGDRLLLCATAAAKAYIDAFARLYQSLYRDAPEFKL